MKTKEQALIAWFVVISAWLVIFLFYISTAEGPVAPIFGGIAIISAAVMSLVGLTAYIGKYLN